MHLGTKHFNVHAHLLIDIFVTSLYIFSSMRISNARHILWWEIATCSRGVFVGVGSESVVGEAEGWWWGWGIPFVKCHSVPSRKFLLVIYSRQLVLGLTTLNANTGPFCGETVKLGQNAICYDICRNSQVYVWLRLPYLMQFPTNIFK